MDFFHKNQNAILLIVILAGGFYVYSAFFKTDGAAVPQDAAAQAVGAEVLELRNNLNSVTLDQSLFTYGPYQALIDFSTPLPVQPQGRLNPFNVIGRD